MRQVNLTNILLVKEIEAAANPLIPLPIQTTGRLQAADINDHPIRPISKAPTRVLFLPKPSMQMPVKERREIKGRRE